MKDREIVIKDLERKIDNAVMGFEKMKSDYEIIKEKLISQSSYIDGLREALKTLNEVQKQE